MHMTDIRSEGRARPWLPYALVFALAVAIASINPIGYIGGGSDDWQYLEAARCAAREGFCVPHTHWAARLPMVTPTAAILATLGESRGNIMLVPLAYGFAAIALFVAVMRRAAGNTAATLAGAALVATPMFGGELTALNVSTVEFFWAIAAAFAFQRAMGNRHRGWAALAGGALALALLSRATAFAFLPILAAAFCLLKREDRAPVFPALPGFAAILLLEAGLYAALAGDPLHGWKLSLGHTGLASSEGAAVAGSPLFNPDVIAGWERSMGIRVHWTIDGALNLLADPTMAPTLWAALALLFLARRNQIRAPLLLLAAACVYFGALTYGLGIDPKPRMFVPVAAAACAIFGLCGARLWRDGGRPLILLILAVLALNAAAIAYNKLDLRRIERAAASWVAPGMAMDETARRVLTLVPAVRRLPVLPAPGATRLLTVSTGACKADAQWSLLRRASFGMIDPAPLAALRARRIGLGPVAPLALCEFRRDRAQAPRSSIAPPAHPAP